jgi:hypothetical protein
MSGIPRELIEHSLNVSLTTKSIKQKLQRFTQDKKEAVRVEITWLLAVGFIKEVYHPTNTALKTPSAYLALTRL